VSCPLGERVGEERFGQHHRDIERRGSDHRANNGDIGILVVGRIDWPGSVELGPEGFRRNVTPSVLGYVIVSQTLHALWVGLAGVLGALWGLRRWVRGTGG
jgi:hypothetical protein